MRSPAALILAVFSLACGAPTAMDPGDAGRDAGRVPDASGGPPPDVDCASASCLFVTPDGAGARDGSDWSNALADLPASLERGAVYWIASGAYGAHAFADPGEQTITVLKATAGAHGTETGWQAQYGEGVAAFGSLDFTASHYVVDGAVGGGPGQWGSGLGFEVTTATTRNYGSVIQLDGVTDIALRHLDVHPDTTQYVTVAILLFHAGASRIEVSHVYAHDIFGPIFQLAGPVDHLVIEDTYAARGQSTAEEHSAGIADDFGADQVIVRDCIWEDIAGSAVIDLVNAEQGAIAQDWEVYGNVFVDTGRPCTGSFCNLTQYDAAGVIAVWFGGTNWITAQHWLVYDNDIVNFKGYAAMRFESATTADVHVTDNVWFCNETSLDANYIVLSDGIDRDYNYYSACWFRASAPAEHEPPQQDLPAGPAPSITDDPFVDWQNGDYRLRAPLAGYPGLSLTAADGYVDRDPLGRVRGADGEWDRGAYELAQ